MQERELLKASVTYEEHPPIPRFWVWIRRGQKTCMLFYHVGSVELQIYDVFAGDL